MGGNGGFVMYFYHTRTEHFVHFWCVFAIRNPLFAFFRLLLVTCNEVILVKTFKVAGFPAIN